MLLNFLVLENYFKSKILFYVYIKIKKIKTLVIYLNYFYNIEVIIIEVIIVIIN